VLAPLGIPVVHADPNDDNSYAHNGPCNSNDVHIKRSLRAATPSRCGVRAAATPACR
jgi:hypothetical protein